MSFRRRTNSHDLWQSIVRDNAALLTELPREALANEAAFRDYVTRGEHDGVPLVPSVTDLSARALDDLWTFIQDKVQFDMDAIRFDHFNEVYRRHASTK